MFHTAHEVRRFLKQNGITCSLKIKRTMDPWTGDTDVFAVDILSSTVEERASIRKLLKHTNAIVLGGVIFKADRETHDE